MNAIERVVNLRGGFHSFLSDRLMGNKLALLVYPQQLGFRCLQSQFRFYDSCSDRTTSTISPRGIFPRSTNHPNHKRTQHPPRIASLRLRKLRRRGQAPSRSRSDRVPPIQDVETHPTHPPNAPPSDTARIAPQ